jgi:Flp pilus assembly protein TadD
MRQNGQPPLSSGDGDARETAPPQSEDEDTHDAAFRRGVACYEAGDLDGAKAEWQRAVEGGHRRAAVNLGFLLQRLGDREGARAAYVKAAGWGDLVAARLAEALGKPASGPKEEA